MTISYLKHTDKFVARHTGLPKQGWWWKNLISPCMIALLILSACSSSTPVPVIPTPTQLTAASTPTSQPSPTPDLNPLYLDPSQPVEIRVEDLIGRMTLEEKIGQMTQVEKNSLAPEDVADFYIGSLLSGGGGYPRPNNTENWVKMVDGFQSYALRTRLKIPLIYGIDAVHGHNNLKGATIFPHNIGLGAAADPGLVERVARATAEEMAATGIRWNFAPVVAVPQDIRWGRTYEGFSENTNLVTSLGTAYLRGLQNPHGTLDLSSPLAVLATPKHFIGDGGTLWGTGAGNGRIDQGDMQLSEADLRSLFLPPYQAAIDSGAMSIMVSFSSWNGTKLHAHQALLTNLLKGELGFKGFLVSDWQAIDQIPGDYYSDVVTSINAGIDMVMVPYEYRVFISTLANAVNNGDISIDRIDDAVRRILAVKFQMGLFEHPYADSTLLGQVGSQAHRALAREAVSRSLVLLKNEDGALPLDKSTPLVYVAGAAANDIGIQCGGWTIEWGGQLGNITPGVTVLEAIRQAVGETAQVMYNPGGNFKGGDDQFGNSRLADVGIVVVGEKPYAEYQGDAHDLSLPREQIELVKALRARSKTLVVILISGRPMLIDEVLELSDAFVAAWLPGTEGHGIADALFGDEPFTGKLPYTWPRSMDQLPLNAGVDRSEPLFPFGYGLLTTPSGAVLDLVWSDEFDGDEIDRSKWTFDTGGGGWGNNEKQYYTDRPENARVEAGYLVIEAREESYMGRSYTSARLKTQALHTWTYARVEALIKVPYGQGIWPAFWMLGEDIARVGWPSCGEIDILENIGKEPYLVHGTVHGPGYSGANGIGGSYTLHGHRFADDFHLFAVEWEPEQIRWYVDGNLYSTLTPANLPERGRWVFDHPFFIIMNVAVGGNWPDSPDDSTQFPQKMLVDYVRVYQTAEHAGLQTVE